MTASDELRRLLDERGVEHYDGTETTLWGYEPTGESTGAYRFAADEMSGGRMQVRMFNITPEQAIKATLGPVTCHDAAGRQMAFFSCSACGATINGKHPRFCFGCGREVVDG